MPRAVLPGVPHDVMQRGLDRRTIFFTDSDRQVYLDLCCASARRFGGTVAGYCLMPNHVHWVVLPLKEDSLARAFGQAHGRYAHYANAKLGRNGHFWQGRFFSCALGRTHLWAALRYEERNPVRAAMVSSAVEWPWSSAACRLNLSPSPDWLELDEWRSAYTRQESLFQSA